MRGPHTLTCSLIGLLSLYGALDGAYAAPYYGGNSYQQPQQDYDVVKALRYEIANHEQEIRTLEERLEQQEEIVDAARSAADSLKKQVAQLLDADTSDLDSQVAEVAGVNDKLNQDLHSLQKQANAVAELVEAHSTQLKELEETLAGQSQQFSTLEKAVQSLVTALQDPTTSSSGVEGTEISYSVVSGDSLEKIARRHNTTIKAIKEHNKLSSDKILIGQKLKIPQ